MKNSSSELLRQCTDAMREGADFPTVWLSILRKHPFVIGPPVQHLDGEGAQLHIRLATGERLIFNSDTKEFSVG